MLKYPPGMGTCSQSPANVNRQSVRASGDSSPGDSTFNRWGFFSFPFFLFLHPEKSRLNELCATKLYPGEETPRDSKCAHQKAPSGIIPKEAWKLGLEGPCVVSKTVKGD